MSLDSFCDRCGILIAVGQYCTADDRKIVNDGVQPCVEAMTPDKDGKVACWCTSFRPRQFKHPGKQLTEKELDSIVANCPCCEGSGRCAEGH